MNHEEKDMLKLINNIPDEEMIKLLEDIDIEEIEINDVQKNKMKKNVMNKVKTSSKQKKMRRGLIAAGIVAIISLSAITPFGQKALAEIAKKLYFIPGSNSQQLPQLALSFVPGDMGFEGLLAYDINELIDGNPWNESADIKTLPVFKNTAKKDIKGITQEGPSVETMLERAKKIAYTLHKTVDETDNNIVGGVDAKCGDTDISVYKEGDIRIIFNEPVSIPENYVLGKNAKKTDCEVIVKDLIKEYKGLAAMKSPGFNISMEGYSFYGEKHWGYGAYEASGDLKDQIIGYNFNTISFGFDHNNKLFVIWLDKLDTSNKIGDYPIIVAEQASKMLLEGKYLTTVPDDFPGESEIKKVELIYRKQAYEDCFMPFYKFYVNLPNQKMENGLHTFGIYYVPAVEPKYLTQLPKSNIYFN